MTGAAYDLLAATGTLLGPAPRDIVTRWAGLERARRPHWLTDADPLSRAEADRPLLLREGRVVLSWVAVANERSFVAGPDSHPAVVVYSHSTRVRAETLQEAARMVGSLLGAKPVDPELAALAADLASSKARPMGRPVPASIAPGLSLQLTTILVHRAHLPRPYLAALLLPILVHDTSPNAVLLPVRMWGNDLRAAWADLAAQP